MRRIGVVVLAVFFGMTLVACGAKSSKTSARQPNRTQANPGRSHVRPGGPTGNSQPPAGTRSQGTHGEGSHNGSRTSIPKTALPTVICVGPNNSIAHWQPTNRDVERARKADRRNGLTREMPSVITGHLLPNGKMAGSCIYGSGFGPTDY